MNAAHSKDPLAGQREAINRGEKHSLLWPDVGQGAPVEEGQVIPLRTCHIEITRVHRVQKGRVWQWRAEFVKIRRHTELTLIARRGDYTEDPGQALRAYDDPAASTIDSIDEEERSDEHRNLGEPPEPEAIPHHEVETLPSTVAARARYAELKGEEISKRLARSLIEEIRQAKLSPEEIEAMREALAEIRESKAA